MTLFYSVLIGGPRISLKCKTQNHPHDKYEVTLNLNWSSLWEDLYINSFYINPISLEDCTENIYQSYCPLKFFKLQIPCIMSCKVRKHRRNLHFESMVKTFF